jgi:hypothetical protein
MTMQKLLLGVVGLITGRYLWVKTRGVPCTDYVYRTCVRNGRGRADEQIPQIIVVMQFIKRLSTRVPFGYIIATAHTLHKSTTSPILFADFEA